mgnify:CR=1 FL=1
MAEPYTITTAYDWCNACESEELGLCKKEQALEEMKAGGSGDMNGVRGGMLLLAITMLLVLI